MASKRFDMLLALRVVLLCFSIGLFTYFFADPRYHAATLLTFMVVVGQGCELWFFLGRTNREVARFLAAARYGDFSQSFAIEGGAGGFVELGEAFTEILERMKAQRRRQEIDLRRLQAVLDHNPVPLISLTQDSRVELLNNAARRLFGIVQPVKLEDLRQFGEDFHQQLQACRPGEKRLVKILLEGVETRLSLSVSELSSDAGRLRLISLQDIGRELDEAQLQAWRDLVRVLTHEIMNSITPVASLSQTTADMAADSAGQMEAHHPCRPELEKISDAAGTVAKRAENLLQFVSRYRELTRLPTPQKRRIRLAELFRRLGSMFEAQDAKGAALQLEVSPPSLELFADEEQLEQSLINLLQNAAEALGGRDNGAIRLKACMSGRGRVTIEVGDNGPGIEERALDKLFVPYFTTKTKGSGIGLALVRQVMISHGGSVTASNQPSGGAKFTLNF